MAENNEGPQIPTRESFKQTYENSSGLKAGDPNAPELNVLNQKDFTDHGVEVVKSEVDSEEIKLLNETDFNSGSGQKLKDVEVGELKMPPIKQVEEMPADNSSEDGSGQVIHVDFQKKEVTE